MSKRAAEEEAQLPPVRPHKAYRNDDFLNSHHARPIRILCEYEETRQRLRDQGVRATVMFFGSARSKFPEQHEKALAVARDKSKAAVTSEDREEAEAAVAKLEASAWMCPIMDSIHALSRRVTEWSLAYASSKSAGKIKMVSGVARSSKHRASDEGTAAAAVGSEMDEEGGLHAQAHLHAHAYGSEMDEEGGGVYVCTGGGPGFMEAANRGASEVPGGKSIGMGITLPFEAGLNPYVTPAMAFEYHYFFTRKFWMAFHMQALVVAPGGFGTCDELFELLTLKQTGKIQRSLPIVLFGKGYWSDVINWSALAKYGVIAQKDIDELLFTDDVEEALAFITDGLMKSGVLTADGADYGE